MLVLALLAVTAPFRFHVDAAEFPNVVYHVSCLSDRSPCTKPEIEKFWHDHLRWTDFDRRQPDAWNAGLDGVTGPAGNSMRKWEKYVALLAAPTGPGPGVV